METASSPQAIEIQTDLPCAICGYNLKGLSPAGNCPECGQPVSRSYQFDLVKANPVWLRRQASTVAMIAILCFLNFAPTISSFAAWFGYAVPLFLAAINVWVCYRLGQPDPADPTDRYSSVRRGVFLASVAVLISVALQWPDSDRFRFSSPTQFWVLARILLIAINTFLALFLVAHLCRRAGSKSLSKHARLSLWAFSLSQPGYFIFFLFDVGRFAKSLAYIYSAYSYLSQASLFLTLILLGRVYEVLRFTATTAEARAHEQTPRE